MVPRDPLDPGDMLTSVVAVVKRNQIKCVGAVFTPTRAIFLKSCVSRRVINKNNGFRGYFIMLPQEYIPQGFMSVEDVKYEAGFNESEKPYSIIVVSSSITNVMVLSYLFGCRPRNSFIVLYWFIPLLNKLGLTDWTNQFM